MKESYNFTFFSLIEQSYIEKGDVNLAYVPRRTDDIERSNEGKVGIRLDGVLPLKRSDLFVGVDISSYGQMCNPFNGCAPNKFIGEIHAGYRIGNLEFYISHMSAHPFDSESRAFYGYVFDSGGNVQLLTDGPPYIVNEYDYITELGIRLKFSTKK